MWIKRGLLLAASGLLTLSPTQSIDPASPRLPVIPSVNPRGPAGTVPSRTVRMFDPSQIEYYLTEDQISFLRPGFYITVNSITVPSDNRPIVDLSFTDDKGQPLDRLGNATPGPLSISFILAWWDPVERHYTAYTTRVQTSPITGVSATQASADSGGTFTDLELGHATYKFKTALPAGYDKSKTHTLAIYATRNMAGIEDKNYYANVEKDFRPDALAVVDIWDKIDNAACNTCHDPLSAHGGSRRDVKLCVTCHQPQTVDPDTGNTVDFKVMIHKIHDGANLPSVKAGTPYVIIGNAQSVNDFSTVVFPQDIRNCTTCHAPPATQASNWYAFPGRAACASCHDDVDFVSGANHPAGPQADDSQCASCHQPQGGREWDASIRGAHTNPIHSSQLKGLNAAIVSVTNSAPGQQPTVQFKLTQNDGSFVAPSSLGSSLNLLMGGPTSDYAIDPIRQPAGGSAYDAGTGIATYTFTTAIPATAMGTWGFSLEARRTVALNPAPMKGPATVTEGAFNPVAYAAVTDSAAAPRRAVVAIANCNTCHDRLALHGGQRFNTEMCVMCHNPNASDVSQRPAAQLPVEAIDFKRMIHRVHTGEDLTQDFTIYGFGGSVNNFNGVRFPGDRRDCEKCHLTGTENVPDNPSFGVLLPTNTPRDFYTPMQWTATACLGCHDTRSTAAHAFVNTSPFGEACATCHGVDAEFSVAKVHAR
jgi:OmcA/MtrC family decaheme c-type cytochrome